MKLVILITILLIIYIIKKNYYFIETHGLETDDIDN